MKRLIAFLAVMMLVSVASGTAVSVTIYGTNRSNAQTNVTCYGCNNTIIVNAWNTSYVKNITVNSTNTSGDTFSFNISNVTANSIFELKINGTSINGYKAGANGMLNFTYTMPSNLNQTFVISPAIRANGYNMTWAWLSLIGGDTTVAGNVSMGNLRIPVDGDYIYTSDTNWRIGGRETSPVGANWVTGAALVTVAGQTNDGQGWLWRGHTGTSNMELTGANGNLYVRGNISGNGSGLRGLNGSNVTYSYNQTLTNSKTFTTVYQNTGSTLRYVYISGACNTAGHWMKAESSAANPPTWQVASAMGGTSIDSTQISFIVLPNNYYRVTTPAGAGCSLTDANYSSWMEIQ